MIMGAKKGGERGDEVGANCVEGGLKNVLPPLCSCAKEQSTSEPNLKLWIVAMIFVNT